MGESCARDVNISWDEIWYEDGFYTVRRGEEYALLHGNNIVVSNLTDRPQRYTPERYADYEGEANFASYYIVRRAYELGLICAWVGSLEVMLEPTIIKHPVYTYNHICRMVDRDMRKTEIIYYALLMSRTPKRSPVSNGDGWDYVPEELREKVREYMAEKDMKQPETVEEL